MAPPRKRLNKTAVLPDSTAYLRSLAAELLSQADRVRSLIGDAHWLSDGHHKEELLLEVVRRHLPAGMIAGRGFVISKTDRTRCSREQDILIVDAQAEAPLLNQGGLLIAFPRSVIASISVKTKFGQKEIIDATRGLASLRATIAVDRPPGQQATEPWCGVFFYVPRSDKDIDKVFVDLAASYAALSADDPPHVNPGADVMADANDLLAVLTPSAGGVGARVFDCDGLSCAVFLARLLNQLAVARKQGWSDFGDFVDGVACTTLGTKDIAWPVATPAPKKAKPKKKAKALSA